MSKCCGNEDRQHLNSKYGRSKSKSCTDCFCFVIFILFVLGLAAITIITGLDHGLTRIFYGYDSYGNVCNYKNKEQKSQLNYNAYDTTGLKYVLYFNFLKPIDSKKVCVKTCPNMTIRTVADYQNYSSTNQVSLCFYNVSIGAYDKSLCPSLPIYKTNAIAHRCVPNTDELFKVGQDELNKYNKIIQMTTNSTVMNILNPEMIKMWLIRVYDDLYKILIISVISLVVAFTMVFLLRFVAKAMVVTILLSISLGFIGLTTWLWINYAEMKRSATPTNISALNMKIQVQSDTAFLTYSIISTVVTVILLMIIFIMRKRICLVIKLFAEAQKALSSMPLLFILPLATFTVLIMFIFYWLTASMMIYSFGTHDTDSFNSMNITFDKKNVQTFFWVYHFIALIWITEFIFGCQALIVASSVAKWYFTRDKKALQSPICLSIKNLIVYHMGSVALGSFLITLVRFPRYVLMYLQDKFNSSQSKTALYCSRACICCLWCLERFIKFINMNAYTIIAIEGKSFCVSAQKAFVIIVENSLRVATINSVGDFMLFLAKVLVTGITLAISVPILQIYTFAAFKAQILSVLLVSAISFLIAHCFFTIYEMVIDAMMVCFCEDCKANDGTEERPYYMSNSLREFIDESSTHIAINE